MVEESTAGQVAEAGVKRGLSGEPVPEPWTPENEFLTASNKLSRCKYWKIL